MAAEEAATAPEGAAGVDPSLALDNFKLSDSIKKLLVSVEGGSTHTLMDARTHAHAR